MARRVDISGSNVLVTGGGRGIGRATALSLAQAGAQVAICARTESELAATAAEISALTGNAVVWRATDVSDPEDVERLAAFLRERWGRVDVLVNNAAALGPVGRLVDVPLREWLATVRGNLASVAATSHAMVPLMERGGCIVNLSGGGVGGPSPQERVSAYVTSKAAIVVLTELLAHELAPLEIRVNAVAPGAAATRFTAPILAAGRDLAGSRTYDEAARQQPAPSQLEDFHRLVAWLASPQSAWLSGRLLSARWDTIEKLEQDRLRIEGSSYLTLRRIDGALFTPASELSESG